MIVKVFRVELVFKKFFYFFYCILKMKTLIEVTLQSHAVILLSNFFISLLEVEVHKNVDKGCADFWWKLMCLECN